MSEQHSKSNIKDNVIVRRLRTEVEWLMQENQHSFGRKNVTPLHRKRKLIGSKSKPCGIYLPTITLSMR